MVLGGITDTNIHNLGNAVFVWVNCYVRPLKLDCNFQDCRRHRSLQEHTRVGQSTDAEKLCQKQMEGERTRAIRPGFKTQYSLSV